MHYKTVTFFTSGLFSYTVYPGYGWSTVGMNGLGTNGPGYERSRVQIVQGTNTRIV